MSPKPKSANQPVKAAKPSKKLASAIFSRLSKLDPSPTSELTWQDPFTLLVAVVLSAQSTDKAVNKITPGLFARAGDAATMSSLKQAELERYINSIGLFRNKAKAIIALSKQLLALHGGKVPDNLEDLMALPGVGRKTANVVLNTTFGHKVIAVDTHVLRVSNRLGLANSTTPDATEKQLMDNIPAEFLQHAHHWLILLGRYTCKARKPECATCCVNDLCFSQDKTADKIADKEKVA